MIPVGSVVSKMCKCGRCYRESSCHWRGCPETSGIGNGRENILGLETIQMTIAKYLLKVEETSKSDLGTNSHST